MANSTAPGKSTSMVLWIALAAGGFCLLGLCCTGGGIGGYFLFFAGPSIAGKWEQEQRGFNGAMTRREWEFRRDGTAHVKVIAEDPFAKGKITEHTSHLDYKLIAGDPLIVEATLIKAEGAVPEGIRRDVGKTFRFKATQDGDTLTLILQDPQVRSDEKAILKRVR